MPADHVDVEVAEFTHRGRRASNQDSVLLGTLSDGRLLAAIADGMGGHRAGDVASRTALDSLVVALEEGAPLRGAVEVANRSVHARAKGDQSLAGMGTTLVAVLLEKGVSYEIVSVGDSRAYRIDSDCIRQLTKDHSYEAEAARRDGARHEAAATSPWRNALTRAIGTSREVEVDAHGPYAIDAQHAVLLCSDGLYRAVEDDLIRRYVLSCDALEAAAETLGTLAYRRGSDDNISIVAVEMGHLERVEDDVTLPIPILPTEPPQAASGIEAAAEAHASGHAREMAPASDRKPDGSGWKPDVGTRTGLLLALALALAFSITLLIVVLLAGERRRSGVEPSGPVPRLEESGSAIDPANSR